MRTRNTAGRPVVDVDWRAVVELRRTFFASPTHPKVTLMRTRCLARLVIGLLVLTGSTAAAQESKSAPLARTFVQLLDAAQVTYVAAKDPSDPEAFVAALYIPGSQLFVVEAKYAPAVLLNEKLGKKLYQEVYIDLNSASQRGTKIFVEDLYCDGLKPDHEENKGMDSIETDGKRVVFYDHGRKDKKMSEEAYAKVYTDADKTYARFLELLIAELKK
jgi:hypothetical protein